MNLRKVFAAAAAAIVSLGLLTAAGSSAASAATAGTAAAAAGGGGAMRAACPTAPAGYERCFALFAPQLRVNAAIAAGVRGAASHPSGLSPADIAAAYKLPIRRNTHDTVAVVEAFQTPKLAANLAVYRSHYGLGACKESTGCLRVVNEKGNAGPLPASAVPSGWDVETMLDVSMVSAACPHCKILVVEARNDSVANLAAAENTAARLGAQVISNSFGAQESGFSQAYSADYDHPGHVIVVANGDLGFTAANFPANLTTVTAVGGTQLTRASNARGWTEQVWNNFAGAGGSGCSAYVAKPAWQHDTHCSMRTVGDVAAVAWNIPIYEKIQGGWLTVGGTSVSAPLIAGVYALAGNATTVPLGYAYAHASSLFDVTKGNNDWFNGAGGATCGFDYLCVAKKGYDAPTGMGTPDGTGAF
jgi:subtilase family serine protease